MSIGPHHHTAPTKLMFLWESAQLSNLFLNSACFRSLAPKNQRVNETWRSNQKTTSACYQSCFSTLVMSIHQLYLMNMFCIFLQMSSWQMSISCLSDWTMAAEEKTCWFLLLFEANKHLMSSACTQTSTESPLWSHLSIMTLHLILQDEEVLVDQTSSFIVFVSTQSL
ncbi:hypothetical protein FQA47_005958 [Oryzias melastigma]|uniref:Uncharacterized protein n=1 Tax=Oryzias melastigma TaxID=30732 RepID=A0A834CIY4_ORYME|nr:hypothetical protein FQA47_005958 [Oryzias melastigma]